MCALQALAGRGGADDAQGNAAALLQKVATWRHEP